jgi:hypothetical protein
MTINRRRIFAALILVLLGAALLIVWRFNTDLERAHINAAQGSVVIDTPCAAIEYQQAGTSTASGNTWQRRRA